MRKTAFLLAALATSGCATYPQYEELKAAPSNKTITVPAPLACLYQKGLEHVTSRSNATEPVPTGYINERQGYAWFRQPLTLVMLTDTAGATLVERHQTDSAALFGQGDNLIAYLMANPCSE
ncbi:hypothetical protein [Ralstonia soli]|uniref:Lipoprotein n=1 Tax=Ralstonia soli TaxID=2953896 RepID=A0ABT1AR48_9RALS|nr:hypothetical protein [Ralstonia soli]MCO5400751.1 hypothetical protein [Ralstonia soli]